MLTEGLHSYFAEESGSDEDFMVDDDDDSDYGRSKKKGKKITPRGGRKVERKEKKSPKPRLKATGWCCWSPLTFIISWFCQGVCHFDSKIN